MATVSTIPDVIKAVRDGLRLRAGLAGVTITNAPIPPDRIEPRTIHLVKERPGEQDYSTIGGRTEKEDYAIVGRSWYIATDKRGDDAIDDARALVYGWWGEIKQFIQSDPHIGQRVLSAIAVQVDGDPGLFDIGIGFTLDFEIRIKNELRR